MQQVQKVNDNCMRRENCPTRLRLLGQHVKCNNTFCTCCLQHFFLRSNKKNKKKNNDKQQFSPVHRVGKMQ
jgi:hypothetical protein